MNESETNRVFPRSIGAEIEGALRSMKDLPENRRSLINDHLKTLISEKRTALAAIKDHTGNTEAYFHIGMLFIRDMMRINIAGTLQERMTSATVVYQPPNGGTLRGYADIGQYFMKEYLNRGGDDPFCIAIANRLNASGRGTTA